MEEPINKEETIKIQLTYKGKIYTSTRKFTKAAIEINGYPDIHLTQASDGAKKCMRDALVNEGKI